MEQPMHVLVVTVWNGVDCCLESHADFGFNNGPTGGDEEMQVLASMHPQKPLHEQYSQTHTLPLLPGENWLQWNECNIDQPATTVTSLPTRSDSLPGSSMSLPTIFSLSADVTDMVHLPPTHDEINLSLASNSSSLSLANSDAGDEGDDYNDSGINESNANMYRHMNIPFVGRQCCYLCLDVDESILTIKDMRDPIVPDSDLTSWNMNHHHFWTVHIQTNHQRNSDNRSNHKTHCTYSLTRRQLHVLSDRDSIVFRHGQTGTVQMVLEHRYTWPNSTLVQQLKTNASIGLSQATEDQPIESSYSSKSTSAAETAVPTQKQILRPSYHPNVDANNGVNGHCAGHGIEAIIKEACATGMSQNTSGSSKSNTTTDTTVPTQKQTVRQSNHSNIVVNNSCNGEDGVEAGTKGSCATGTLSQDSEVHPLESSCSSKSTTTTESAVPTQKQTVRPFHHPNIAVNSSCEGGYGVEKSTKGLRNTDYTTQPPLAIGASEQGEKTTQGSHKNSNALANNNSTSKNHLHLQQLETVIEDQSVALRHSTKEVLEQQYGESSPTQSPICNAMDPPQCQFDKQPKHSHYHNEEINLEMLSPLSSQQDVDADADGVEESEYELSQEQQSLNIMMPATTTANIHTASLLLTQPSTTCSIDHGPTASLPLNSNVDDDDSTIDPRHPSDNKCVHHLLSKNAAIRIQDNVQALQLEEQPKSQENQFKYSAILPVNHILKPPPQTTPIRIAVSAKLATTSIKRSTMSSPVGSPDLLADSPSVSQLKEVSQERTEMTMTTPLRQEQMLLDASNSSSKDNKIDSIQAQVINPNGPQCAMYIEDEKISAAVPDDDHVTGAVSKNLFIQHDVHISSTEKSSSQNVLEQSTDNISREHDADIDQLEQVTKLVKRRKILQIPSNDKEEMGKVPASTIHVTGSTPEKSLHTPENPTRRSTRKRKMLSSDLAAQQKIPLASASDRKHYESVRKPSSRSLSTPPDTSTPSEIVPIRILTTGIDLDNKHKKVRSFSQKK
jgi:hypothetical protein